MEAGDCCCQLVIRERRSESGSTSLSDEDSTLVGLGAGESELSNGRVRATPFVGVVGMIVERTKRGVCLKSRNDFRYSVARRSHASRRQ